MARKRVLYQDAKEFAEAYEGLFRLGEFRPRGFQREISSLKESDREQYRLSIESLFAEWQARQA